MFSTVNQLEFVCKADVQVVDVSGDIAILGLVEQSPVITQTEFNYVVEANTGANTQFDIETFEILVVKVEGLAILFIGGRKAEREGGTGQGEETKLVAQREAVFGFYRNVEKVDVLFDSLFLVHEPGIDHATFDPQVLNALKRHFAKDTGIDTIVGTRNRNAVGFVGYCRLAKAGGSTPTDLGKTVCGKSRR